MDHFNSPILNRTSVIDEDIDQSILDQSILDVLDLDVIGLPIDEDPFELISMLRSLSENLNKSKIEITKLRNARDSMIEVKTLLEVELNKLRNENIEIMGAVQDVAAKLQKQGLVIEEQSLTIKKQNQMLTEKDNEIAKLQAIIFNMQHTSNNDKDELNQQIINQQGQEIGKVCSAHVQRIDDDNSDCDDIESDSNGNNSKASHTRKVNETTIVQNSIDFLLKL